MMQINILLIEDDPDFSEFFTFQLAQASASLRFQLHCETTLASALDYLERSQVDLIVADLGLPDSCGPATAAKLAAAAPEVPFVVLSGEDEESAIWEVLRCGAEDHLVKMEVKGNSLMPTLVSAIAQHFQRAVQPRVA